MNQKELLLISVTIFLTIVSWMLVDIYKVKTTANPSASTNYASVTAGKLDEEVFNALKEKQP